jgi:hypothetical protein
VSVEPVPMRSDRPHLATRELGAVSRDGGQRRLVLEDPALVIAGYTGRDARLVEQHIAELEDAGVERPALVPSFWAVPNWLLAVAPLEIEVAGGRASGEAEPVLIRLSDGSMYLTVGSDITDRAVERHSIALSKVVCPKVIASEAWHVSEIEQGWDAIVVRSFVGDEATAYQLGTLEQICAPTTLLDGVTALGIDSKRPLVLFLGTVPLLAPGFRYDGRFRAELVDQEGRELSCAYRTISVTESED